jgi:hypothetical protein
MWQQNGGDAGGGQLISPHQFITSSHQLKVASVVCNLPMTLNRISQKGFSY